MRASFNKDNLASFVTGLSAGKGGFAKYAGEVPISKSKEWDGKDAKPPTDDL
jgi:hypothetical protein